MSRCLIDANKRLSNKVENKIKELIELFRIAKISLEEASKISLSNEPLKGVGSDIWINLYNAAKEYSTKHAYSENQFPNIENDSLCVLCMQPIKNNDVKSRFIRFKEFMEDTIKKDFDNIKKELSQIHESIDKIHSFEKDSYNDVLNEISDKDKNLYDEIIRYIDSLQTRKKNIQKVIENNEYTPFTKLIKCPRRKIYYLYNELGKEVHKLEGSLDPDELQRKKEKFEELESRKLLFNNKKQLKKYLHEIIEEKKYDECIKEIQISAKKNTLKGKEIISNELSPQLTAALDEELKQLGGSRLPVFFKVIGEKGTTEHKMCLNGARKEDKVSLCDVLSEGEQKIIAIAGFFAELKTNNQKNPIVFDDPVCSLDHNYKRKIAERLAKESKDRQIIVFTHDLPFLMMLQNFCDKYNIDISIKSIERTRKKPGICSDFMPWDAMNVKDRVKRLQEKCNKLKDIYEDLIESKYNEEASSLYNLLRETWERLVEELLLNGIVYRFNRDIQTQRIKRVTDISDDDYKKVAGAMDKCSIFLTGHDNASELNESLPEPDEIMDDIREIEEYRKQLCKRNRSSRR